MLNFENRFRTTNSAGQGQPSSSATVPLHGQSPRIESRELLSGSREVVIDHSGVEYRLRVTRNDKLILTK